MANHSDATILTPGQVIDKIERGSPQFRRVTLGLFLAGLSTFTLLYCVQPLLPLFSTLFGVTATNSSLALSLSTASLAISIVLASVLSERFGRKPVMAVSLVSAAVCQLAVAVAPGWHTLLVLRALEGLCLGGTPAVAMAYIAEEVGPGALASVMGLYIGGNAIGGMSGRLLTGIIVEASDWRVAMGVIGAISLAAAFGLIALLPASRHFRAQPDIRPHYHLAAWTMHLRNPRMRWYYLIGFLVMGAFVTIYNYTGYRLERPPYALGQSAQGAIFLVYILGTMASTWSGPLGDRFGRAKVLNISALIALAGALLMLAAPLPLIIAGVSLVTIGFFGAHSAASAAVGRLAESHKGHASSLYLLFYYLGSSVVGSAGGLFWAEFGWPGVVAFVATGLIGVFAIGAYLARTAPMTTAQMLAAR
ncbi:YNFM family putative membrane transporter [Endobacter medicaginis]|uniref:MFS transporter n=1 Tax=Endobacter medicaginis TaxID=1181271 RepID=A0A850NQ49_9PROT|nr:MFS transporter [Endobacter medicaginis]MBB3173370.1 YNFM family putative membrane transporter [Endobacter medicaginis]MCX5477018.1 MFS transporter [Endobacter medicaginis]NVN31034.1 MFS transporter [Endobacter medicaginis]